jgi:hypothetical protein
MNQKEYEIVTADTKYKLQEIVNLKIGLGYKPLGGVSFRKLSSFWGDGEFYQALVKRRARANTPPTEENP